MIRRFTRSALEAFPFPVVSVDRGGYIISLNRSVTRGTGLRAEAAAGRHFSDVFYRGRVLDQGHEFISPLMDTLVREREIINHRLLIQTDLHRRPVPYTVTTWLMRNRERLVDMVLGFYVPDYLPAKWQPRNLRTIHSFNEAMEFRDPYTRGHLERVAIYAVGIARALHLDRVALSLLFTAAITHDIGKIAVPPEILNKPGRLDPHEKAIIRQHPQFSANVLKHFEMPEPIITAVLHHHERYDGQGYPAGLKGTSIPFLSRILSVADAFEAMTSARIYRSSLGNRAALNELARCAGTQFDPRVVDKTLQLADELNLAQCKGHQECLGQAMCRHCTA
jgi:putative nucleotidyltransferase with HDIG domain/PAS domain S-box-containing protein